MKYYLSIVVLLLFSALNLKAQTLTVDAGGNVTICNGNSTPLTATPTNGTSPYSYTWAPSLGLSATNISNPIASPTVTTTYTVTVSSNGSTATDNVIITVYAVPTANFSFNPNNSCSSNAVNFTNTSTGLGLTSSWNFNDPTSATNLSTAQNPSHSFLSAIGNSTQSFNVSLTVTSSQGCSDSKSQSVTVKQSPEAKISDINGLYTFTSCGTATYDLTVKNKSSTSATNTNYNIDWGDLTSNYSASTLPNTLHSYSSLGYFSLVLTVTGGNGCVSNKTYVVYNGSNPSVGLGNPGGTVNLCVPHSLTFPITGVSGNPPGTVYTITTNTGEPSVVYNHPPPASYTHNFTNTSCGASGAKTQNTFFVSIRAENPCGFSDATVEPITTSIMPIAKMSVSPDSIACINTTVTFTNTSTDGISVDNHGTCDKTTIKNWTIAPLIGWSITSGSLGDQAPDLDPNTWGSNTLGISFNTAGTYFVSLIVRNTCGNDTVIKNICIQPSPTAAFTANPTTGCDPLVVNTTNSSNTIGTCSTTTYSWSVSPTTGWHYSNGTSSSSFQPQFTFAKSGTYNISLSVQNRCTTSTVSHQIIVKGKPTVTIDTIPNFCNNATIHPTATINDSLSTITSYSWTFAGGNPATSTLGTPGAISYATNGVYTVNLTVTNSCGTGSATRQFTITPPPVVTVTPTPSTICNGSSVTLTASGANTYLWSPTGSLNSSTSPTVTATPTNTTTYTVIGTSGCTNTAQAIINVNPLPNPTITGPTPVCLNTTNTYNVTDIVGHTYSWSVIGGTIMSGQNTASISIKWTASTGCSVSCEETITATTCNNSNTKLITINPLPTVNAGTGLSYCNQNISNTLSGYSPTTGGNGVWTGNGINNPNLFNPAIAGLGAHTLTYTFTDNNGCINTDTIVVHVVAPSIAQAGNDTTVCMNSGIIVLKGIPTGGTWTGTNVVGSNFTPSSGGAFTLTYSYGTGSCLTTDTKIITVNTLPTITITANKTIICNGDSVLLSVGGANTYQWSPILQANSYVKPSATTTYTATGTNTTTGCYNTNTKIIIVNPLPTVNAGIGQIYCNQNIPAMLSGYTPTNGGVGVWSGSGVSNPNIFNPSTAGMGAHILTYTFTDNNGCINSDTVIAHVVSPSSANAGNDTAICLNSAILTLVGIPSGGTWSGTNVSNGDFTPSSTGSFNLTYSYGAGSCLTSDTKTITVNTLPNITVNAPTICSGDIATLTANGGDSYSWSTGGLSNSISVSPTTSTITSTATYTVTGTTVASGCQNTAIASVLVKPLPNIVAIPIDDSICSGATVNIVLSSAVTGTIYSWTPSINSNITGQSSNSSTIFNQTLTNSTNTYQTITYKITTNAVGCKGDSTTVSEVVRPKPHLTAIVSDTTICASDVLPSVSLTSDVMGSRFSWHFTSDNGITPANGNGNTSTVSANTFQNTGAMAKDVHYVFKVSVDGCSDDSILRKITVNPRPTVINAILSDTVCSESTTVNAITLVSNVAGTTFNWTSSTADGVTGFTPSGTYTIPRETLTYNGITNGKVTYHIIPTNNASGNKCPTIPIDYQIVVYPKPHATYTYNPNIGGTPLTVNFTNQSTTPPLTNLWSFGDNIPSSSSLNPSVIFTNTGATDSIYAIKLIVTTNKGCKDTVTHDVTVHPLPTPAFNATNVCIGLTTVFHDASTSLSGSINQWSWNFGDGNSSTSQNPTHTYSNAGTYSVTLTITNTNNCTNTITKQVVVYPLPIVNFAVNPLVCKNSSVSFTNQTTGASSYNWQFGDGTSTSTQSPTHSYSDTGVFVIKQIATTQFGCKDSTSKNTYVIENPISNFTTLPNKGCAPLSVQFKNTSAGQAVTYNWDFGNGITQTIVNSDPTTHNIIYPSGRNDSIYHIILTTTNLCGTSKHKDSVTVYPTPDVNFGLSQNSGCSPFTLSLINTVNSKPDTMKWDFGDGSPTQICTLYSTIIKHTFTYIGLKDTTYTIKLIAINSCGSDTIKKQFTVLPNTVHAFFNIDSLNGCVPLTAHLTNYSTGANQYSWDFGDGNYSNLTNPSHTYSNAGQYTIRLAVTNGCSYDTVLSSKITVLPNPIPNFSFNDNVCEKTGIVNFTNLASNVKNTMWYFGDGATSANSNPIHTYNSDGTFTTTLKITNQNNCVASKAIPIHIKFKPKADFTLSTYIGCEPLAINFTNKTDSLTFNTYIWNFGNGVNSISPNPAYQIYRNISYCADTTYKLMLIANNSGCVDTTTTNIVVHPRPLCSFNTTNNLFCTFTTPIAVTFIDNSTCASSHNWYINNSLTSSQTNPAITFSTEGSYSISQISTNQYTCKDTATRVFMVYPNWKNSVLISETQGCTPFTPVFQATSYNHSAYKWNFGDGTTSQGSTTMHTYQNSGSYNVKVNVYSEEGCKDSITLSNIIDISPSANASFTYENLPNGKGYVSFINTSNNANSYRWNFGDGSTFVGFDTTHRYTYNDNFNVALIANNIYNCPDTAIVQLDLTFFCGLYIPNALTPNNGSPEVRLFTPKGVGIKEYKIEIFDTWGNKIWESTALNDEGAPAESWDGFFNGKLCEQDAYVWKAEAVFKNGTIWKGKKYGNTYKTTGTVTIIR